MVFFCQVHISWQVCLPGSLVSKPTAVNSVLVCRTIIILMYNHGQILICLLSNLVLDKRSPSVHRTTQLRARWSNSHSMGLLITSHRGNLLYPSQRSMEAAEDASNVALLIRHPRRLFSPRNAKNIHKNNRLFYCLHFANKLSEHCDTVTKSYFS